MSLTAANFAANLVTARRVVAAELGVNPTAPGFAYEDGIRYNRALAAYVLQYPASFSPGTLETARRILGTDYAALQDSSFDWGEFGAATADNAPAVLGGFTNKLLLIAAVAAVAWVFLNSAPRSGPPPAPAAA